MMRVGLMRMVITVALLISSSFAQQPKQQPKDLHVELRSTSGSTRFQIGEVITLELVLSSSTPNRYLEPCELFVERNFGYPQCRFFNRWSFDITPEGGWVDLTKEYPSGPLTHSGPMFQVPNRDLSTEPVKFTYVLTSRYRFSKPGDYRVRLTTQVALDDETTQRAHQMFSAPQEKRVEPHSVTITPEIVLHIVPASPEWDKEIIRKGIEAYSGPEPRQTDPPSPDMQRYKEDTQALCTLGTPDAARALARLLAQGHEVQKCLLQSPSEAVAKEVMERLLVDSNVGVSPTFFTTLVALQSRDEGRRDGALVLRRDNIDTEREKLFASIERKVGDAKITSLVTVLQHPPRSKGSPFEMSYTLPFPEPVIAAVVANFDELPAHTQQWLFDTGWDAFRSPLMLPIVRRRAQSGNGQPLLRWLELEPAAATEFIRAEIVRPAPRFSSYYLRLPDESLPKDEETLANNFVALKNQSDLIHSATLLHRYATKRVLPTVLPFIDANRAKWHCSIQFPALAYLLKVSPTDAAPRVKQALREANHSDCVTSTFFTDLGFLQPAPILDKLALAQVESGTEPFARDAANYLRQHAPATMKPALFAQLERWQKRIVESGAEKRYMAGNATFEELSQVALVGDLREALLRAQGWLLTSDEINRIWTISGKKRPCGDFGCSDIEIGSLPREIGIYGRENGVPEKKQSPMEYLNPQERLFYSVGQYRCADMRALKDKLLQIPKGATFFFTYDLTARDQAEIVEISDFLWSHGYKVSNPQTWSFLRPDPPRE